MKISAMRLCAGWADRGGHHPRAQGGVQPPWMVGLWSDIELGDYSGLMPAALMNFAHFSVSRAKSLLKSADVIGTGSHPRSASRSLTLGSARPALISRLSLSMISPGVWRGAAMPKNPVLS